MVPHYRPSPIARAGLALAVCAGIAFGSAGTATAADLPLPLPLALPALPIPLPPPPPLPLPALPALPLPALPLPAPPALPLPPIVVPALPLPALPNLPLPSLPGLPDLGLPAIPGLPTELPVIPGVPVPGPATPGLPTELPVGVGVPVPGPVAPASGGPAVSRTPGTLNPDLDFGRGSSTRHLPGSVGSSTAAWNPYADQMSTYAENTAPAATANKVDVAKASGFRPIGQEGDSSPLLPLLVAAALIALCALILTARRAWSRVSLIAQSS